jgi:molybdate transport system regulatory protein
MDEQLRQAILEHLDDGKLPCSQAFAIVAELGVDPMTVGDAANEAGMRISYCQLGLFGYGPKAEGRHKIVQPMEDVPAQLAARLRAAANDEGITCAAIWQLADTLGYTRLQVSSAAEAMSIKVSRCQLGCFPRP